MSSPNCDRPEIIMQIRPPHTLVHGAGGLPSAELTPETVKGWIARCAELGVTAMFWYVNYVGKATYHSDILPRMTPLTSRHFMERGIFPGNTAELFNSIAAALERFDTLEVAMAAAKEHGIALYADLGLFDMYFPGLENDFLEAHPECWLRGRVGRRPTQMYGQIMPEPYQRLAVEDDSRVPRQTWFRGLPCYAETAVQDYWLSIIRELMDRGVGNFVFNLMSHVQGGFGNTWRVIDGDEGADAFGFNPPVVAEYQKRHGVDILSEAFEPARLYELHGEFFTAFLRRIRQTIGPDRRFIAGTTADGQCGYGVDGVQFRMKLDWRQWIDQGIADDLMVYDQGTEPTAVEDVRRQIKSRLSKGRVFCWRVITDPADFDAFRREMDQACAAGLDGYGMKELARIVHARLER